MKNLFNDGLLSVIVLELMIGGSGRFLEVGSVTARMLLYVLAMIYSLFLFARGTVINKYYINLTILFFILSSFSLLIGLFNHADPNLIWEDLKQLLYFPMIIFFSIVINTYAKVVKVSYLIKLSSIVLLVSYLSVLLAVQLGVIPFNVLYDFMSDSDQFVFRGETGFVYRGFIVLCFGVFFFVLEKHILSKIMGGFMFIGIVLTFTRGFIYSTILVLVSYLAYFNLKTKNLLNVILLIMLPSVIAASFLSWFLETLGDKGESDSVRLENIQQVLDGIDNTSFFIGHGLGVGVEIRPVHMEISYLEIFHKQGVLGLIFWTCILLILIIKFTSACRHGNNLIATSFFLSSIFVFIQSLTNPYLNNPIGMSIIIISIVCLDVLSKYSNSEETNENQRLHGHI
ncbi:MAG: hypothetical protein HEQ24_06640 [Dolichospermum sp. BR01]|nr:hypothetical protein [Dolichospermum sp. BR01]